VSVEYSGDFLERVLEMSESKSARSVSRSALRLAEEAVSKLLLCGEHIVDETVTLIIKNRRGYAKIKQNTY
jgi:hypothetical protein